jgi:hypothetical protein
MHRQRQRRICTPLVISHVDQVYVRHCHLRLATASVHACALHCSCMTLERSAFAFFFMFNRELSNLCSFSSLSTITVIHGNSGTAITIANATANDTIRSIKRRVSAANSKFPISRQLLHASAHDAEPLADDETLGGAGVAQDGTGVLDLVLELQPNYISDTRNRKVCRHFEVMCNFGQRITGSCFSDNTLHTTRIFHVFVFIHFLR